MVDHYYSRSPQVASNPHEVTVAARGLQFNLKTDAGVFSKSALDRGTQILVETVELKPSAAVVDLGCGYGPVTALLGRTYPDSTWTMLDVNQRALNLAKENTANLGSRVSLHVSDGFEQVPDHKCTDVILNPPIRAGKSIVYRLFREARDHLLSGGSLWVVIQKKHGAASTHEYLKTLFANVEVPYKKAGYYVFRCN